MPQDVLRPSTLLDLREIYKEVRERANEEAKKRAKYEPHHLKMLASEFEEVIKAIGGATGLSLLCMPLKLVANSALLTMDDRRLDWNTEMLGIRLLPTPEKIDLEGFDIDIGSIWLSPYGKPLVFGFDNDVSGPHEIGWEPLVNHGFFAQHLAAVLRDVAVEYLRNPWRIDRFDCR